MRNSQHCANAAPVPPIYLTCSGYAFMLECGQSLYPKHMLTMPEKILIIDDDLDSLRLISLMLKRHGYDVITANTGSQGLSRAISEYPTLLILDIMMPDMDGYDVCRRLRANPATKDIPIIMFTAKTLLDDKLAGFEAGADDYLTKPTHPSELASRVKAILHRKASQQTVAPGIEPGLVIGVVGTKGGLGTTTLALNIAAAFNTMEQNPIVADFRLGAGNLGLFMGVKRATGMANLARRPPGEIPMLIERELVTHTTGLRALLSSIRPQESMLSLAPETALAIIDALRGLGAPTVLDLGSSYSPLFHRVLTVIDRLVVLVEPNGVNLVIATGFLSALTKYDKTRINIVVIDDNHVQLHPPWHEVEHVLDHELRSIISKAPELVAQAVEAGMPVVNYQPNAILATQITKLAEDILRSGNIA